MSKNGYESFAGSTVLHGRYGKLIGSLRQNLCQITLDNTPGDIIAINTAPTKTGGAETFDLTLLVDVNKRATINFALNGVSVDYVCSFVAAVDIAAVTAAEAVVAITGAPLYSATHVACVEDTGNVKIDGGDGVLGTSAEMIVTGAVATTLGINGTTNGTGAPSEAQVLVNGFDGQPGAGVRILAKIYDASTAGALLADTYIQLASKGAIVSGEGTNDAILMADGNGEVDFEIVSDISGIDSLYLELSAESGGFLVAVPASREQIDKTA